MVRFHSMVRLVSNSSSTTYTMNKAQVDRVLYAHLQSMIDMLGIDGKAEDLFEVVVERDGGLVDRLAWDFYDENYSRIKETGASSDYTTWPDEIRTEFNEWLKDSDRAVVSQEKSYYGEEDDYEPVGKILIKARATGLVNKAMSDVAFKILDITRNGSEG